MTKLHVITQHVGRPSRLHQETLFLNIPIFDSTQQQAPLLPLYPFSTQIIPPALTMLLPTGYLPISMTALVLLDPVHANPVKLEIRQPTPNPLEFLNLNASAIAPSPGSLSLSPTTGGKCATALLGDGLVFPNAVIVRSAAGYIECQRRLVFNSVPVGFAFSVLAVEVGGVLELERGSVLEEVSVEIGYMVSISQYHPVLSI